MPIWQHAVPQIFNCNLKLKIYSESVYVCMVILYKMNPKQPRPSHRSHSGNSSTYDTWIKNFFYLLYGFWTDRELAGNGHMLPKLKLYIYILGGSVLTHLRILLFILRKVTCKFLNCFQAFNLDIFCFQKQSRYDLKPLRQKKMVEIPETLSPVSIDLIKKRITGK